LDTKGKTPILPDGITDTAGPSEPSRWTAPAVGVLKVNVDAGWDVGSRKAGIGIVVRDHTGHPIISEWKPVTCCTSAEDAESLACLEGLKHLIGLQCHEGILESDCLRPVQALLSDKIDRSTSWCNYSEGKELLRYYPFIKVVKVDRVSNSLAYALAQLGKSGSLSHDAPDCVRELVFSDMM
jgi:ribonuclease HI